VADTLNGVDACIVTIGNTSTICSEAQPIINEQVLKAGLKRVIAITSLGVGDSYEDLNWFTATIVNTVIAGPIRDKNKQEEFIKSQLDGKVDWTIVRPGRLTDGQLTGKWKAQERGLGGGKVSRADLADFILKQCLALGEWCNKAISIV
jgi:hypothetical protein